ncbi:MAG: RDD family protein [Nocardioides sp.]|nr:RDD family protein [Nocardioides sp.]
MTPSPAADLDRRFYAFAVDRLVAWSVDVLAAFLAWRLLVDDGSVAAGIGVTVAVVLLVYAVLAVVLGLTGSSPGNAALGLRTVGATTGVPIGVGPALLRQLVLGLATVPTFGLGTATLAWTAAMDPGGRRHGWHDRLVGSEVVDVRPVPAEPEPVAEQPRGVVNLTALRLVPAPPPPSTPMPSGPPAGASPPPHPAPAAPTAAPRTPQHRAEPATARVAAPAPAADPARQRLGYPLLPEPTAPAARWRVSFDSGESFVVEGLTLVGRRPEPRAGESPRHLLALRSDDMSLSKTHAQFQVVADGVLVAMDRGSTNGSVLLRQGVYRDLTAGRPTTLLDGDHVRFGDRIMTVAREA